MLYDDQERPTLEQMRAALRSEYGPVEAPVYDDGASLLGQNPDMYQVGMFKTPKFNPARRTMGLNLPKTAVADEPATTLPAIVSPPVKPAELSPLEAIGQGIANMPMTRRKFMNTPVQAAIAQAGKGLLGTALTAPIKEAVQEMILPTFSEEEIASKTGQYITGLMANPDFRKAYIDTVLPEEERDDPMFEEYPDEVYNSWAQLGGTRPEQVEAFKPHLNLDKMAKDTGIPLSELQKYTSETELHNLLNRMGDNHSYLTGILEDGRPKEAWRSTALGDLNYKKIVKSAVKELGKDADYTDILSLAEDKVREEYINRMQRGMPTNKQLKAPLDFNERAVIAGAQNYTQQLIDDVYDQGSEYVVEELESQLDSLLGD
jgi:hypothetical protein